MPPCVYVCESFVTFRSSCIHISRTYLCEVCGVKAGEAADFPTVIKADSLSAARRPIYSTRGVIKLKQTFLRQTDDTTVLSQPGINIAQHIVYKKSMLQFSSSSPHEMSSPHSLLPDLIRRVSPFPMLCRVIGNKSWSLKKDNLD